MRKRIFGKRCGFKVAPLSIGAMRLPDDGMDAVALIRTAIDRGMIYIDTSRGYGESELILGRALKDGYRKKVILSSKCSPWVKKIQSSDDGSAASVFHRIQETVLRLDVGYLDFYQVWNINSPEAWKTATRKGGMVDGIRRAMKAGLVRHTGFTTHEKPENLLQYLDKADWAEIILITWNLLERSYAEVFKKAHQLGIGTIAMNPCGGGQFSDNNPAFAGLVQDVGAAGLADLAIRYVYSNPDIDTMLCGMTCTQNLTDSIASIQRGKFTAAQMRRIDNFLDEQGKCKMCTGCNYCMPCPVGINIPALMNMAFHSRYYGLTSHMAQNYTWHSVKADACIQCRRCEQQCTQRIPIVKELAAIHKELSAATKNSK
jgi:predicted aldo/keto reductase-like oxidoreductase